jgi:ankyrin repeat protein
MQLLATFYIGEKKWKDAKKVLSDLLFFEKPEDHIRERWLHDLSEVYLALGEFENARKCCKNVFESREKRLGEGHVLYFQSAELLARISHKEGDLLEEAFYRNLLASDSHGMNSSIIKLIQACAQIENLCSIAEEVVTETPTKSSRNRFLLVSRKTSDVGPNKAAHELGRVILKDYFQKKELETIRQNIIRNQSVVGTGYGLALIHAFARRGRTSIVKLLLEKGTDVDALDSDGMTVLICAVIFGHEEMVRLLLENGADIEISSKGNTALIAAAMQNGEHIVRQLLDHGAEIEAKNDAGYTALHIASAHAYVKVVQLLLDAGADINTRNKKGITPLMSAAQSDKFWMVCLLLNRGADVNAKDEDGDTALRLHLNKQAARMMAPIETHPRLNTPITQLLKLEMNRRQRIKLTV